jgi:hypothetical protein
VEVTKTRFEDAGEQDENGYYNYFYAGYAYRFVSGQEAFIARQYDDMSDEASFLTHEIKGKRKWKSTLLDAIPYESLLFREAIKYLLQEEQVRRIKVLLREYMPVSLHRFKFGTKITSA